MKIFAVEPTNICNARCSFCPYPTPDHNRKKGYMSIRTLDRILSLVTGDTAAINGLGEPLLHKQIDLIVRGFAEAGIRTQLNTNGRLLTQGMYDRLLTAGLTRLVVTADFFPWERKIEESDALKIEVFTITRDEPNARRKDLDDWAGQIGRVHRNRVACSFVEDDWYQIQWNGDVLRCCADFNGNHRLGNIHYWKDEPHIHEQIPLCRNCWGYVFRNALVVGDYEGEQQNNLSSS